VTDQGKEKEIMSTLICDSGELAHFTGVFSDITLIYELALRLTGREAAAMAGLFRALGEMATADLWTAAHAAANQPPSHETGYVVPVDPMDDLQCDSCQ
jgi:hypothetical protein